MIEKTSGFMSPWSCCFLNCIDVESIYCMSQNWCIYIKATITKKISEILPLLSGILVVLSNK